jgi:hypothetical protein
MYRISSHGHPKRGGPPASGFGDGLTTPYSKTEHATKWARDLRSTAHTYFSATGSRTAVGSPEFYCVNMEFLH